MWSKFGKNWIICKQIVRRSLVFDKKNQTTVKSVILREVRTGKQGKSWCSKRSKTFLTSIKNLTVKNSRTIFKDLRT